MPSEFVRVGNYDGEGVYEHSRELLTQPNRPTAIFAGNDRIALIVLQAAADLGLRVPDDLSVVGFDDIGQAEHSDPPLTTVRQPLTSIGELAAKLLISRVENGKTDPEIHLIDPELIERRSTAPPPRV
jgi:LacI family transcriptional regulator